MLTEKSDDNTIAMSSKRTTNLGRYLSGNRLQQPGDAVILMNSDNTAVVIRPHHAPSPHWNGANAISVTERRDTDA